MTDLTKIDFTGSTLKELEGHKARLVKAIGLAEKANKKKALAAIKALLADRGFTLADIQADGPSPARAERKIAKSPRKPKAAAKYRNPRDNSLTWSGKGRPPGWFKAAMDSGATPEQLEIGI